MTHFGIFQIFVPYISAFFEGLKIVFKLSHNSCLIRDSR